MKKHFHVLSLIALGLAMTSQCMAVDWSSIAFLGDGAGGGKYSNKYKVEKTTCMQEVVNVQHPGFASEDGIYIAFPEAISSCSHKGDIQGAGICLHISQFTAQETEVTVTLVNSGDCVFHVFYADGTTGEGGGEGTGGGGEGTGGEGGEGGETTPIAAASCSGHSNGVDAHYTQGDLDFAVQSLEKGFDWVISNDVNGKVNIVVTIQDALPGMAAPCIFFFDAQGVLQGDPIIDIPWNPATRQASYELKGQKAGTQLCFLIKVALEAGKVLFTERMNYTVGQSCDTPSGWVRTEAKVSAKKAFVNGQLVVEHAGRCYNILGTEMR